jgi:PKHD-type hydroxylase
MFLTSIMDPEANDGVLGVGFAQNAFTREECEKIIEIGDQLQSRQGALGAGNNINTDKRNSEICTLVPSMETKWVYEKMNAIVLAANRNYKFELYGVEAFQVATYGPDNYYGWHMDLGKGPTSNRKLGISLQLSDKDDYEGGDLEFRGGGAPPAAPREIGTIITFPSFLTHQVAPVTNGVRKSLVAWVLGPPFK